MTGTRGGFGLPVVLAVLAVAAIAALGSLRMGLRRALDANDALALVRTRSAAESAVRIALGAWDADSMRAITAGITTPVPAAAGTFAGGVTHAATVERIGANRFLLRGVGEGPAGGSGRSVAAALATVAMVPTDEIWRDFSAALASGDSVHLANGAVVSGMDAGVPATWSSADCPAGLAATVAALLGAPDRPGIAIPSASVPVSAMGATVAGLPPVLPGAPRTGPGDFFRLGSMSLADIAVIADRTESGTVHLAPSVVGGVCDTQAPGNWGAPSDPAHPCFGFLPLVFAGAGLEIASGNGQGILVVDGDLTLRPGVALTGLVLATGRIELDGAVVSGALRAGAGARIAGAVRYGTCVAGRTLDGTRALRRPYRLGDRLWLPAF